MKKIKLNGAKMTDKITTHIYLKKKLGFPDYYGKNLDALWDCLSTDYSQKIIIIINPHLIEKNLGFYGKILLKLFDEVSEQNQFIQFIMKDKNDPS